MLAERDTDYVITVWRMVHHTDEQEVGAEGKLQPEVLLGVGRCKVSTRAVGNRDIDAKCNSATGARFRPIKSEERVTRKRHSRVGDVPCKERFCLTDVWFFEGGLD